MAKSRSTKILMWVGIFSTIVFIPTILSLTFSGREIFASWERYLQSIAWGTSYAIAFWLGNWAIGVLTGRKLDWKKHPSRSNLISLLSFIVYGSIVSLAVPYTILHHFYGQTGDKLFFNVLTNAFVAFSVDMIVISIYYSRYLVHYWKKSIEANEMLEREKLQAKYDALKSQVNPHFLFNSLNTLTGVVENTPDKAVTFIKKLSDIYRYVLDQRNTDLVTVSEEINFVENYIFLAKLRHGEGLAFANKISKTDKMITPLGLQILVENCIQHNIIEDDRPLTITITEEEQYLCVRNNLQKKSSLNKNGNNIGLENLRNRYTYLTDLPVIIDETNESFTVKIPLLNSATE